MLSTYLFILRGRWPVLLVGTVLLAPLLFLGLTSSSGLYQSTAVVQVLNGSVVEGVLGTSRGYQDPERLLASEIELLNSGVVARGAAELLREDGLEVDADRVRDSISVAPRGLSSYIEVVGRAPQPERARALTAAFVNAYQSYKLRLQREELEQLDEELRARLAETEAELVRLDAAGVEPGGAVARQRARTLGTYESLSNLIESVRLRLSVDASGIEVLSPASEPEQETGTLGTVPAAVVAVLAGLALSSGLALLLELLRDPVRSRSEARGLVPSPLALTLLRPRGRSATWLAALRDPRRPATRTARAAYQRWRAAQGLQSRHVLVTGLQEDAEHRQYAALAFASAAAAGGARVLLVGESLADVLGLDPLDETLPGSGAGVPTLLPGVRWSATPLQLSDAATPSGPDGIDLTVRLHEDEDEYGPGPVPSTLVVAVLGRTRGRALSQHAVELEALGLPVGAVLLLEQEERTRPPRSRRPHRGPEAPVPATWTGSGLVEPEADEDADAHAGARSAAGGSSPLSSVTAGSGEHEPHPAGGPASEDAR